MYAKDMNTLAGNIREARTREKMSQTDLADEMMKRGHPRWSYGTASRVERGIRTLWLDELFTLIEIFSEEILDGTRLETF